jgi:hypothetical protein
MSDKGRFGLGSMTIDILHRESGLMCGKAQQPCLKMSKTKNNLKMDLRDHDVAAKNGHIMGCSLTGQFLNWQVVSYWLHY